MFIIPCQKRRHNLAKAQILFDRCFSHFFHDFLINRQHMRFIAYNIQFINRNPFHIKIFLIINANRLIFRRDQSIGGGYMQMRFYSLPFSDMLLYRQDIQGQNLPRQREYIIYARFFPHFFDRNSKQIALTVSMPPDKGIGIKNNMVHHQHFIQSRIQHQGGACQMHLFISARQNIV